MRVRSGRKIWLVALMVFVAVFLFTFLTAKFKGGEDVDAANLANFDPGYIISDYQMGNYSSMSEAEIWNFLKQKGNCNDTRIWQTGNNLGYLSESAPYSWHVSDGHYVCLADENFSGESAAHIIWQAAQDYRINPQVLIVLLQKEQGLITDSFPNSVQYRSATGYGCPDTAACSSRYYGFKNQVRNAAALFRTVLDGGWTNYPLGNNYIQYNPNSGCGGSWVNIRSLATSALYRYTPYQPNASALAAGYGAGDSCGSYGNRNFYSYFEDWFGGVNYERDDGSRIKDYYENAGGESGRLGSVVGEKRCGLSNGGCFQEFKEGRLYWDEINGVSEVSGGILYVYGQNGFENGVLGYPLGNEQQQNNDVVVQKFKGGEIFWTPTGTLVVSGGVNYVYSTTGAESGVLGYPISGEQVGDDGVVYQEFEHGTIYWTSKNGAWVMRDYAVGRWNELGGVNSKLGQLANTGVCGLVDGGCYQGFKNGNIYWSNTTGSWDVSGGIYYVYLAHGTEWGQLGYPISGEQVGDDGVVYQEFEHGTIYWTSKNGAWVKSK